MLDVDVFNRLFKPGLDSAQLGSCPAHFVQGTINALQGLPGRSLGFDVHFVDTGLICCGNIGCGGTNGWPSPPPDSDRGYCRGPGRVSAGAIQDVVVRTVLFQEGSHTGICCLGVNGLHHLAQHFFGCAVGISGQRDGLGSSHSPRHRDRHISTGIGCSHVGHRACAVHDFAQHIHLGIGQRPHRDVVARVGAHLEHRTGEAAVQQLGTVEAGGFGHTVHFIAQLLQFRLQRFAVGFAVGGVARLHGQLAHALQHVAHFAQSAFGRLRQRDAVVGIARGHRQAFDLGVHALGNGQASSIVFGTVHPQARRQALHGGGQRVA